MLIPDPSRELTDLRRLTSQPPSLRDESWTSDLKMLLATGKLVPTVGTILTSAELGTSCLVITDEGRILREHLSERGLTIVQKGLGLVVRMYDGSLTEVFSCGQIVDYLSTGATSFEFPKIERGTLTEDGSLVTTKGTRGKLLPINHFFIPPPVLPHIAGFLANECGIEEPRIAIRFDSTEIPSLSLSIYLPKELEERRAQVANRIGFYMRSGVKVFITHDPKGHYVLEKRAR